MANIGDRGLFGLAVGTVRPCEVVNGPVDVEGVSKYDIVVSVCADDDYLLEPIEQVATQYTQSVGEVGIQQPQRHIARRVQKSTSAEVGKFWIP